MQRRLWVVHCFYFKLSFIILGWSCSVQNTPPDGVMLEYPWCVYVTCRARVSAVLLLLFIGECADQLTVSVSCLCTSFLSCCSSSLRRFLSAAAASLSRWHPRARASARALLFSASPLDSSASSAAREHNVALCWLWYSFCFSWRGSDREVGVLYTVVTWSGNSRSLPLSVDVIRLQRRSWRISVSSATVGHEWISS